ncbi:hypothetical protein [Lentilactobacillus otakiensis]|uniref:hypothetical protein n=1 Tax=Lentilactobacillus otakiensis TaxID=481720 RepID=UPI00293CC7A3|nr:hypothetical protein [Lentilactobacillus otakiensis]MDV3519257.1 hypothetical protein [Lentilactobacillus otakiensis]
MKYKVKNVEKLQRLIRGTGASNQEFARNLGITNRYLSSLLHQRVDISEPLANLIAYLVKTSRNSIFFDSSVAKSETKTSSAQKVST